MGRRKKRKGGRGFFQGQFDRNDLQRTSGSRSQNINQQSGNNLSSWKGDMNKSYGSHFDSHSKGYTQNKNTNQNINRQSSSAGVSSQRPSVSGNQSHSHGQFEENDISSNHEPIVFSSTGINPNLDLSHVWHSVKNHAVAEVLPNNASLEESIKSLSKLVKRIPPKNLVNTQRTSPATKEEKLAAFSKIINDALLAGRLSNVKKSVPQGLELKASGPQRSQNQSTKHIREVLPSQPSQSASSLQKQVDEKRRQVPITPTSTAFKDSTVQIQSAEKKDTTSSECLDENDVASYSCSYCRQIFKYSRRIHFLEEHVPWTFSCTYKANENYPIRLDLLEKQLTAIHLLCRFICGRESDEYDLLEFVVNQKLNPALLKQGLDGVSPFSLKSLCRYAGWMIPDKFNWNPPNSPALLTTWYAMGFIISQLTKFQRNIIYTDFHDSNKTQESLQGQINHYLKCKRYDSRKQLNEEQNQEKGLDSDMDGPVMKKKNMEVSKPVGSQQSRVFGVGNGTETASISSDDIKEGKHTNNLVPRYRQSHVSGSGNRVPRTLNQGSVWQTKPPVKPTATVTRPTELIEGLFDRQVDEGLFKPAGIYEMDDQTPNNFLAKTADFKFNILEIPGEQTVGPQHPGVMSNKSMPVRPPPFDYTLPHQVGLPRQNLNMRMPCYPGQQDVTSRQPFQAPNMIPRVPFQGQIMTSEQSFQGQGMSSRQGLQGQRLPFGQPFQGQNMGFRQPFVSQGMNFGQPPILNSSQPMSGQNMMLGQSRFQGQFMNSGLFPLPGQTVDSSLQHQSTFTGEPRQTVDTSVQHQSIFTGEPRQTVDSSLQHQSIFTGEPRRTVDTSVQQQVTLTGESRQIVDPTLQQQSTIKGEQFTEIATPTPTIEMEICDDKESEKSKQSNTDENRENPEKSRGKNRDRSPIRNRDRQNKRSNNHSGNTDTDRQRNRNVSERNRNRNESNRHRSDMRRKNDAKDNKKIDNDLEKQKSSTALDGCNKDSDGTKVCSEKDGVRSSKEQNIQLNTNNKEESKDSNDKAGPTNSNESDKHNKTNEPNKPGNQTETAIRKSGNDSDKKSNSSDTDKQNNSNESDKQITSIDSDKQNNSNKADKQNTSNESDKQKSSNDSDKQNTSNDSDKQKSSNDFDKQKKSNESDKSNDSDRRRNRNDRDRSRDRYDSRRRRDRRDRSRDRYERRRASRDRSRDRYESQRWRDRRDRSRERDFYNSERQRDRSRDRDRYDSDRPRDQFKSGSAGNLTDNTVTEKTSILKPGIIKPLFPIIVIDDNDKSKQTESDKEHKNNEPEPAKTDVNIESAKKDETDKRVKFGGFDAYFHFDRLVKKINIEKGDDFDASHVENVIDLHGSVTPSLPVDLAGGIMVYNDPETYKDVRFPLNAKWKVALGVDPSKVHLLNPDRLALLQSLLFNPLVSAVGGIGLDMTLKNFKQQEDTFTKVLGLLSASRPLMLHIRERLKLEWEDSLPAYPAHKRCLELLQQKCGKDQRILIHCFTGNVEAMLEWTAAYPNVMFSFSGYIEKFDTDQKFALKSVPMSKFLLETTAPFFPTELGLKYYTTPAYLGEVAKIVARVKKISPEEVLAQSLKNAKQFFRL